jgi:hypothetical protein
VTTYTVHAKRWARGWELHVDGVGVTQTHGLSAAEAMARSYIAMMREVDPDSFTVHGQWARVTGDGRQDGGSCGLGHDGPATG